MFVLYVISESRSVPLVKKEGEQKIYPGVYVTTGSDILDLYDEDVEGSTAGWTWEEINKDEFYVYDDEEYKCFDDGHYEIVDMMCERWNPYTFQYEMVKKYS